MAQMNISVTRIISVAYCCLLLLIACSDDDQPSISPNVEKFLNEVLDLMEANAVNKATINWTDFRARVINIAGAAQTIAELEPAIAEALTMLADNHSFFQRPDGSGIFVGTIQCQGPTITTPQVPANVGYIKINAFSGTPEQSAALALNLQSQIKEQDSENLLGWIVDLRNNGGGNMWPMIAGIGPILGEGIAGYFAYGDDTKYPWSYNAGAAMSGGNTIVRVAQPYVLMKPWPKVAVLLNNGVASSGEAVAISFIGRLNTKRFGSPTCGLSTSNVGYPLSNGYTLILTTANLADRNGTMYGGLVQPDQTSSEATVIQDAIEWIAD